MTYQPRDRGPLDEQFWTLLNALGSYAERRELPFTIGSELRPARRNPLYRRVVVPQQRVPLYDLMNDRPYKARAARRVRDGRA